MAGRLFPQGAIRRLLYESFGGANSPMREMTLAQLGHPALSGESIYVPDSVKEYDDQVWLHELSGDYALPDDADTERDDFQPAVFTGYLAPEKLLSGRRKYGTTVRIKWVNGRYEVEGVAGPPAENFLRDVPEIDYIVIRRPQLDWGLLRPTDPPSERVVVGGGVFRDESAWYARDDVISVDLISTYAGSLTPGQAVAVQIEEDVSDGSLTYTAGSAFTDTSRDSETGAVDHGLVFANYPTGVSNALRHWGWVKLYYNMTVITEQDILVAPDESAGGAGALLETDLPDVAFANKFGAKFTAGTAAARPATADGVGDAYWETDTGILNICSSGTTWTQYAIFDTEAGNEGYLLLNGNNAMSGELDFSNHAGLMTERGSAPSTPSTSDWKFYFKSDGLYVLDDGGAETGPLGTGGGGGGGVDGGCWVTGPDGVTTVSNGSSLTADYDTEEYDTDSYVDLVSDDTQVTMPSDGLYSIFGYANVTTGVGPDGSFRLKFGLSPAGATTVPYGGQSAQIDKDSDSWQLSFHVGPVNLSSGDIVTMGYENNCGVQVTIQTCGLVVTRYQGQLS